MHKYAYGNIHYYFVMDAMWVQCHNPTPPVTTAASQVPPVEELAALGVAVPRARDATVQRRRWDVVGGARAREGAGQQRAEPEVQTANINKHVDLWFFMIYVLFIFSHPKCED